MAKVKHLFPGHIWETRVQKEYMKNLPYDDYDKGIYIQIYTK